MLIIAVELNKYHGQFKLHEDWYIVSRFTNTLVAAVEYDSVDVASTPAEEGPPAKRHKQSTQYLCTGYDAYLTEEPCVM